MAIHFGTLRAAALLAAAGPAAPAQDSVPRPAPAALTAADLEAWLDGRLGFGLAEGDVPGAMVVVVKDGRVLLAKGYGYADVERKVRMDADRTVFGVGSVSKLFGWTAVMQQVEQGRLALDGDIAGYLDFPIPAAFGRPILVRHLMTHTAGFEERDFRTSPVPRSLRAYLVGTPVPQRITPPGEVTAYSNYGAMIGGYLVERVSGEPFADYVERHIFAPLGMTRSSFRHPLPPALKADQAQSYPTASEPPYPADALDHEEPATDPSGHLYTTGADIARFMLAHLDEGRTDQRLMRAETMRTMHTPDFVPLPGGHPITHGFYRTDYRGHRMIAHPGDIEGFHADLELMPDDGVGFFIGVNGNGASRGVFGAGHQLRSTFAHEFIRRYFPAPPDSMPPALPTAQAHAAAVAGEYRMSRRAAGDFMAIEGLLVARALDLRIRANDDGTITTPTFLDFEQGRAQRWREVEPFHWREIGGEGWLDAKVEGGQVRAVLPRDLLSFVLEPAPWATRASWNVPLAFAAITILALTALSWIGAALIRRKSWCGAAAGVAAVTGLVYLIGWMMLLGGAADRPGAEWWIRLVQLVGLVVIVMAALAVRRVIAARRSGWRHLLGRTAVAFALLDLVWLSVAFHLLSVRLNY